MIIVRVLLCPLTHVLSLLNFNYVQPNNKTPASNTPVNKKKGKTKGKDLWQNK